MNRKAQNGATDLNTEAPYSTLHAVRFVPLLAYWRDGADPAEGLSVRSGSVSELWADGAIEVAGPLAAAEGTGCFSPG